MLITAVVICRNEEESILRCLHSAGQVCGRFLVVDTGSTDKTRKLVKEWLKSHDGELVRRPWVGFAHNRTEALALARGRGDYLLTLDADHVLHLEDELPELQADEYMIRVRGPLEWHLPLLLRGGREWRYEGAAHSYLVGDGAPSTTAFLPQLSIDGGSGATREKLERDLAALTAAHAEEPLDARTVFYLAQTHHDLGNVAAAIQYYRLRSSMGGFAEETFYARYRLGCLLCEHVSFRDGAHVLLAAWESRPTRIEPLRALANSAIAVADKQPRPDDVLFVSPSAYRREAA